MSPQVPATRSSRRIHPTWRTWIGAMAIGGIILGTGQLANASSTGIDGTHTNTDTIQYDTPRTNTYNQNAVWFTTTGNTAGGGLAIGLRWADDRQFARGEAGQGATATVRQDNGSPWVPRGTFYLNVASKGACGGNGCGSISWSANFSWNEPWG